MRTKERGRFAAPCVPSPNALCSHGVLAVHASVLIPKQSLFEFDFGVEGMHFLKCVVDGATKLIHHSRNVLSIIKMHLARPAVERVAFLVNLQLHQCVYFWVFGNGYAFRFLIDAFGQKANSVTNNFSCQIGFSNYGHVVSPFKGRLMGWEQFPYIGRFEVFSED